MGFLEAVRSVFQHYATFSGRARRAEYWWFVLFSVLMSLALGILDAAIFGAAWVGHGMGGMRTAPSVFGGIFSLAILLPSLAVTIRRLHDVGRSGWWWWLWLLPVVGWLVLIYWMIREGDHGDNAFGPDPITEAGLTPSGVPRVPRQ